MYTRRGRCYTTVTCVTSLFPAGKNTWFIMPKKIPEWPSKTFVSVYVALQKDSLGKNLTAADTRAIEQQLPIYIESYFPEVFSDPGTLQGMKDMESRTLDGMADHKHKHTGLSLDWKTEDTAAARESAEKLTERIREINGDKDKEKKIAISEYFEWFTYETRYRLCLDQRPPPAAAAVVRRGTNNRYISIC